MVPRALQKALQTATLAPTRANVTPRGRNLTWRNPSWPDPTNQQYATTNQVVPVADSHHRGSPPLGRAFWTGLATPPCDLAHISGVRGLDGGESNSVSTGRLDLVSHA